MIFGSLLLAVLLFGMIFWGINKGKAQGRAEAAYTTAENVFLGLQNFYSDQDRYPSLSEFSDQAIMLSYLSVFPLPDFPDKTCSQSFVYKRPSADSFQLSFCLPVSFQGFNKGWNTIEGQPGVKQ